MWSTPRQIYPTSPPIEESGRLAELTPPTGYEPKLLDDFHYSETTEIIFWDESSDKNAVPSYTLMKKVCCQLSHFFCVSLKNGEPVHELSSLSSCSREKPSREMENERIRILLERQKEQILADFRAEIHKHEFQADSDRRSIQELNGIIEPQRREIDHTIAGDEQLRRDQLYLHEQLTERNRDLPEAHVKSLHEMGKN